VNEHQRFLPPARGVHVDQTPGSAIRRVTHHLPDDAEDLLKGRVQILNIWRPLFSPLQDHPLALCDYRSTTDDDYVATDLPSPHYEGELFYVKHNKNHRWWFLDSMTRDEALIIKCFDSDGGSGISKCTPHTSFEWSGTPAGARPRESIEVRALCFS